jgi:hypothetical protein
MSEFDPDKFIEKKSVEVVITTTETGFAVSLKTKKGVETLAFRFHSIEAVDYDNGTDDEVTLLVILKSGRDFRFNESAGINPEDIKKIWETLVDNM